MSIIKIADISHVRFTAPDLQRMEDFLVQFGLAPALWSDGALYARDPATFSASTARLDALAQELANAEDRWLELEMKRSELE